MKMLQPARETQYKGLTVEQGRTKLTVNHNGADLTFLHPPFGPDTYANVRRAILKSGLKPPTMAENASLVYGAFNSDDKYGKEIRNIIDKGWLFGFTGTLFVPKGAYIQDDPQIRNGMPFMEESELVRKLEMNDPSVRFVPFGYGTEEMKPAQLGKNEYVIGLAGEEGAEKLAEAAGKYKHNPSLWSFKSVDRPITSVSAVGSNWYFFFFRLYVVGDFYGYNRVGRAFAALGKTGEAR